MTYKSGLDPENDPIVYTTDYGLNIRYANTTTYLPEYTYFTAGGYNWIIIGYDPSLHYLVGEYTGQIDRNPTEGDQTQMSTIVGTPAGTAILKDMFAISQAAQTDFEIGEGGVLCLCEIPIEKKPFHSSSHVYSSSALRNHIKETLYGGQSELSKALQALPIEPQTLVTAGSDDVTDHLFPLATSKRSSTEKFKVETYLGSDTSRICGDNWWLRSGCSGYSNCAYSVRGNGLIAGASDWSYISESRGVRPAFVLKLI